MKRIRLKIVIEESNAPSYPKFIARVDEPRKPAFHNTIGISRESLENVYYDLKFECFRKTGQIVDLYV